MVLGIFSQLAPVIVPVIFMALGLFVSFIQAFVFSLLSTIYIGLATAHEHEEGQQAHH
jgi:F-type H+-transporting ATPase subunit a